MKFAPVCPIHIYEHLYEASSNEVDAIGTYFLLLAHDVLENEQRYRDFFETLRAESDITIIMDNSVIELGKSVSQKTLIHACNVVNADVLVIPDELNSGAETSRMAEEFVRQWMDNGDDIECGAELMFVPQGVHQTQWEICAKNAAQFLMPHIKWIGIPRNLTGRIYRTRMDAVSFLERTFEPEVKFHMLGFSDNSYDDILTCKVLADRIEGIDSAVPLRITEPLQSPMLQDPGKRGTWWETVTPTQQQVDNVLEIRRRIEIQP